MRGAHVADTNDTVSDLIHNILLIFLFGLVGYIITHS